MAAPVESSDLQQSVLPRRRRRLGRLLAGLLVLQLGAAVALALREPRDVTHATTTTITNTIAIPSPPLLVPFIVPAEPLPATTPLERTSCPPARTDAPRLTPPELPEAVEHVRAAPTNAGWIAAWSAEHVYASTDAGASFRRVLDGPGLVRDVTFDCYGHVLVLREDRVGIRDGETERWNRVPGTGVFRDHGDANSDAPRTAEDLLPAAVVGGGPDVVVVANLSNGIEATWYARLSISHDLGRSWRHRDLASYSESEGITSARQDPDGAIHLAILQPDCMSTGLWWATLRGDVLAVDDHHHAPGDVRLHGDLAISASGQWKRHGGEWQDITGLPSRDNDWGEPIPGALPTYIMEGQIFRIAHGRATKLNLVASGHVQTVDRAGRIWTIVCGQPALLGREALPEPCNGADI